MKVVQKSPIFIFLSWNSIFLTLFELLLFVRSDKKPSKKKLVIYLSKKKVETHGKFNFRLSAMCHFSSFFPQITMLHVNVDGIVKEKLLWRNIPRTFPWKFSKEGPFLTFSFLSSRRILKFLPPSSFNYVCVCKRIHNAAKLQQDI